MQKTLKELGIGSYTNIAIVSDPTCMHNNIYRTLRNVDIFLFPLLSLSFLSPSFPPGLPRHSYHHCTEYIPRKESISSAYCGEVRYLYTKLVKGIKHTNNVLCRESCRHLCKVWCDSELKIKSMYCTAHDYYCLSELGSWKNIHQPWCLTESSAASQISGMLFGHVIRDCMWLSCDFV